MIIQYVNFVIHFEGYEAVIKQMNKGKSLTKRHVSRTHRVDVDRPHDRTFLDPTIHIRYVNTTKQFAHILTEGSFTGDRRTLLVNIMTHTTVTQSNLSVSSAVVNPPFSSMSKRAGESFAASASAAQKPAHCAAMIARKTNDTNADMDFHAVPPPVDKAGGDSKRAELCQQDPQTLTIKATGASSSSGRPVALTNPLNTGEGRSSSSGKH